MNTVVVPETQSNNRAPLLGNQAQHIVPSNPDNPFISHTVYCVLYTFVSVPQVTVGRTFLFGFLPEILRNKAFTGQ